MTLRKNKCVYHKVASIDACSYLGNQLFPKVHSTQAWYGKVLTKYE